MPPPKPIADLLADINAAENGDASFLVAATINLYSESIRRRQGRVLYTKSDVEALFTMINMVLHPPVEYIQKPSKPHSLTEEEARHIETGGAEGEAEIPFAPNRRV